MVNVFANPPYILQTRKLQLLQLLLQLQRICLSARPLRSEQPGQHMLHELCPPGIQKWMFIYTVCFEICHIHSVCWWVSTEEGPDCVVKTSSSQTLTSWFRLFPSHSKWLLISVPEQHSPSNGIFLGGPVRSWDQPGKSIRDARGDCRGLRGFGQTDVA